MAGTALLAAASAIPGPQQPFVAGGAALSSLFNQHPKDKQRIAAADAALQKALAGDSSQLAYMISQRDGSATSVGKEAFRRALAIYDQRFGTNYASQGTPATAAPSPLQSVVTQTTDNVKRDVANGVQQVLTGAVNSATSKISNSAGTSIPFTKEQLYIGGAIVLAIVFLPKLLKSRA